MSHLFISILALTLFSCSQGSQDEETKFEPEDPPSPYIVAKDSKCMEDGRLIIRDAYSGEVKIDEIVESNVNALSKKYVKHIGGDVRATSVYEYHFKKSYSSRTLFFWNIGSTIYMSLYDSDNKSQIVAHEKLDDLRGGITALATFEDGDQIGIIAGSVNGISYLRADPDINSIDTVRTHQFPILSDKKIQMGITSIDVDIRSTYVSAAFITTTDGGILSIPIDNIKSGHLGCYNIIAREDEYVPIKSAVVRFNEKEYLAYLSHRLPLTNVSTPVMKEKILSTLVKTMVADEEYGIVKAVDLRSGDNVNVKQWYSGITFYDRWIPMDIVAEGGTLTVLSLIYDGLHFNDYVIDDLCKKESLDDKVNCLIADGMLDVPDNSNERKLPKVIEVMNKDSIKRFALGIYDYDIPTDDSDDDGAGENGSDTNVFDLVEEDTEDIDKEEKTPKEIAEEIFDEATNLSLIDTSLYPFDKKVPSIFLKSYLSGDTLFIRGVNFIKILRRGGNRWYGQLDIHPGSNIEGYDEVVAAGIPSSISAEAMGNRFYLNGAILGFDGRLISLSGNSISESLSIESSEGTPEVKEYAKVASGFSVTNIKRLNSETIGFIRPLAKDAGAISIYESDSGHSPVEIDIVYGGERFLARNFASNGSIYCYDGYRENDIGSDVDEIKLFCQSGKNGSPTSITVPTDSYRDTNNPFFGFPASENNTYQRVINDIEIESDYLIILLGGYNGTQAFNYRVVVYEISTRSGSLDIEGPIAYSRRMQKNIEFGIPDTKSHFISTSSSRGSYVEGYISSIWGVLKFKASLGTPSLPKGNQTLKFLFEKGDKEGGISEIIADDSESKLVTIGLLNNNKITIRDYSEPTTILGSFSIDELSKTASSSGMVSDAYGFVRGDILYLNTTTIGDFRRFYLIDISDPSNSKLLWERGNSFLDEILSLNDDLFFGNSIGNGLEIFQF